MAQMSNATMASSMSAGLYMFFFIASPVSVTAAAVRTLADDSNPASADSVNGMACNEMSFESARDHERPYTTRPHAQNGPFYDHLT